MSCLVIEATEWNADAERILSRSVDETYRLDDLRRDVKNHDVLLFNVKEGGAMIGAFALRVETTDIKEIAMVAGAADAPGREILLEVEPFIMALAELVGAEGIRVHTVLPAFYRLLCRNGYSRYQYVMRKRVGG